MPPHFTIILAVNWTMNTNSFVHSIIQQLSTEVILGFAVAIRCTKDDKTDEASALLELTL